MKTKQIPVKKYISYSFSITVRLLMISLLLILSSCDSFTEVDFPESQLTGKAVFEDPATVQAAFSNIYSKLRDNVLVTGNSNGLNVLMGLYSDELDYYGVPGEDTDQFYRHIVLPSNAEIASIWNDTYNLIYATNSILEGVANSTTLSDTDTMEFMGEALFIRAYLHFYLSALFGDIPYIKTTDYALNSTVSRILESEITALIIQDLQEAHISFANASLSPERIRPSAIAVSSLLARIYLYSEDYTLATQYATEVIENGGLTLGNSVQGVFNKNSSSTIWQLKPESGNNTWEAFTFIFPGTPPPFVALTPAFIDSFENDDDRKENWIGENSEGNDIYYYPYKYKIVNGSNNEYSILLRLGEQYLIRAEAQVKLNKILEGKSDLDIIRARAGLPPSPANTTEELLNAIEMERRHELFTEQGHRWFDLKRTERAEILLPPIKPGWRQTDILLPIPETELILNPNLAPQNPGY